MCSRKISLCDSTYTTAARFPISIEKGTTGRDLHLKAWAIQLGTSTFVGQYTHAKTKATFSVKVRLQEKSNSTHWCGAVPFGGLVIGTNSTLGIPRVAWYCSLGRDTMQDQGRDTAVDRRSIDVSTRAEKSLFRSPPRKTKDRRHQRNIYVINPFGAPLIATETMVGTFGVIYSNRLQAA